MKVATDSELVPLNVFSVLCHVLLTSRCAMKCCCVVICGCTLFTSDFIVPHGFQMQQLEADLQAQEDLCDRHAALLAQLEPYSSWLEDFTASDQGLIGLKKADIKQVVHVREVGSAVRLNTFSVLLPCVNYP